jgi:homospermidine synthase
MKTTTTGKRARFDHKVLIVGYGSVAHCTLPVLLDAVDIPLTNITIIDFEDKAHLLQEYTSEGLRYFQERITPQNLSLVLSKYLDEGGLCIDLAWNIAATDILAWCHDHKVLYINTSVEVWDSLGGIHTESPYEKSLYARHMRLRELIADWKDATTAVVDHGANPGLISHFVKQGLLDIAARMQKEKKATPAELEEIKQYAVSRDFARLAWRLGVKVIHCSERDTQVTSRPREVNEFVGTWSIEGLREEGTAPAEMGWGTHEQNLPGLVHMPQFGPKNCIFLAQMGMNTWVRSWIPDEEIVGMVIRHGESFGITDRLTVWQGGEPVYRPTVHYAYMPCHETLASLSELRGRNYVLPNKLRIMEDEIVTGTDTLGALLMGHAFQSWWTGSALSIEQARALAPGRNATTLQVSAGVVGAVLWMLENPARGLCLPDDLPHDFILGFAKPYLGKFISKPSGWTPLKNRIVYFSENPASIPHPDVWQFRNFQFLD